MTFKLGDRLVGKDCIPLVIAEIGINHSGSLELACEMVDAAARAGAEIIKHQTHVIDDEMSRAARHIIPGNANTSIYDVMKRCALGEKDELLLKKYVEAKGMLFLSTPFSRAAADRLESFGVKAYKIGSGECNNIPLIKHICKFRKPIILSTGMNTIENIRKSVEVLEENNINYALMHCTNIYPTPANLVRLGGITQLEKEFPNAVVGLSDHTINNNACIAAIAIGASLVERHFTDYKSRQGPDIECSMDQTELEQLIEASKEVYLMRGGNKALIREEQVTMDFAFATVVSIRNIPRGERLTEKNIWVKRPGTGEIPAEKYEIILGKCVNKDIKADTHIKWGDIE